MYLHREGMYDIYDYSLLLGTIIKAVLYNKLLTHTKSK